MVASCSATNCTNSRKNNSNNVTFHRFPLSNPKLCKQWIRAICQPDFKPSPHHLLCSDHFEKSCFLPGYVNRRQLKKNAVPTLFHCLEKESKQLSSDPEEEEEEEEPMSVSHLKNYNVALSMLEEETADLLDDLDDSGSKAEEEPMKMQTEFLCRVCACTSDELVPVFGERGSELQLLEKIHIHLPIMVTPEDVLPVTMCTSCICKLEMCHQFVHGCLDADMKLRTILGLEMEDLMLYSDEYTVESQRGMAKDPSVRIKREELYSHMSEGSTDEAYENHAPHLVKSEESDDSRDYTQHPEISVVVPEQDNEVGVDDMEYDAVDDSQHPIEQLGHTAYSDSMLVCEQNSDTDAEGAYDLDHETYDLDHHLADKLECSKYTEIPWTQIERYNELDAEYVDQVEYDVSDIDQHCDQLQGIEEQEDSFDQQGLEYIKNPESVAATKKLKTKRENSKLKVVVVKVKDAVNKTHTSKFRKASRLMLKDFSSNRIQQSLSQQLLEYQESANSELILKSSALPIGNMKSKEVRQENPTRTHADHSYTYTRRSFYPCIYCRTTLASKDGLIAHQVTEHPGKVFCCEQCGNVYYSKELLDEHQKSHLIEMEDGRVHEPDNCLKSSVCIKQIEPLFSSDDKVVENGIVNTDSSEKSGTWKPDRLENNPNDMLSLPEDSEAEEESSNKNIQRQSEQGGTEEIRLVDIHIEPERETENRDVLKNASKFSLKLSKEFENLDQDYKSKILETVSMIMERNGDNAKIEAVTSENMKKETEKEQENLKTANQVLEVQVRDNGGNSWKCNLCDHISPSLEEYQEHHQTHPQLTLSCSYCDKQFSSQRSLGRHVSAHHSEEKCFICEHCGESFHFLHTLRDHLSVHDKSEQLFHCDKCEKDFESKASYDNHSCRRGEASYLCDICGKSMRYLTSLRLHRLSHTDPGSRPEHSCTVCGKEYSSRYLLAEHMKVHTDEYLYQCKHCGKQFQLRSQLLNHKLTHANVRKHKCPICGKGFTRRQHMRVHIRGHQRSLKYACKICSRQFSSVGELIMHRKTHTQEEIVEASKEQILQGGSPLVFMCQICGKHLASKFTLKNHVMMHANDKPFHCEICGKSFTMKSSLQTHHRVHTRERPHTCQHCGEAFQSRQNLVVHERIHTGETPFKCTQCDKAYRSRHSLRQHLLFHADYRPYECLQCGKRFRRQDILITHIRTHTGERPFACNVCGRAFKQKGDCNKHQLRHMS